jgi:hypothetical protein
MPEDSFDAGGGPMDSWRPKAGPGSHEIIALNRPFAACGMELPRFRGQFLVFVS